MSATPRRFAGLRQQFAENPRLRWGGVAIAAILGLYLLLLLSDWKVELQATVRADAERLQKIQALAGQDQWQQRAAEAAAVKAGLLAEIPSAQTPGLAQAALQTHLRTLLGGFGNAVAVEVAQPAAVDTLPGWVRVPATLSSSSLDLERIKQVVQVLESQSTLVVVDSLTINNRPAADFSLTLSGYYRLAPETGAADAP